TEDDFRETLSLVEAVGFDDAFTFRYSPREGTPATRLKDVVLDHVAGERLERLVAAVRGIARRKNVALVGSNHEVLVEGWAKRGDLLQGRTRDNKVAPSYVSTPQGEVLVELRLDSDQEKAKLDVALLEGFRKVGLAPRCGARPVQLM